MKKSSRTALIAGLWLAAALCLVLLWPQKAQPQITLTAPSQDSPMGPRKTMNYGGSRYAFLENGGAYSLSDRDVEETLGTLEGDILRDPGQFGLQDLASTFALGGRVCRMTWWDSEFRLGVEYNGSWYIAQKVGNLDGSPLELETFFRQADLESTAEAVEIRDHLGREILDSLTGREVTSLAALLARCQPVTLETRDYEALAGAQSQGESFFLRFLLSDGTDYSLYLVPSLKLALVGDGKYTLPEAFFQTFSGIFDALPREPIPMM